MIAQFTNWLLGLLKQLFKDIWDFFKDVAIELLDLLLSAVIAAVGAIPVPAFLSNGMQGFYGFLDPAVIYFLGLFGLPEALAMFGVAFLFRMARKVVTLFQW